MFSPKINFSMKSIFFSLLIGLLPLFASAQNNAGILNDKDKAKLTAAQKVAAAPTDTIWKVGGTIGLNFSQSYFSNWASGGQNSISGTAFTILFAKYQKGRNLWDNSLNLAYGQMMQGDQDPIKTDDQIDLTSTYGYQLKNPNWYYTILFNFRSQFAPGYTIEDGVEVGDKTSDFLAPGYLILSPGMGYHPNDNFSFMVSPITMKMTIVTIDELATAYGLDAGDNIRTEFGAFVKASYQKDIFENVNLLTKIDLFSNYADNPQNIDVNWETIITMKINSWLSASLNTQVIYDDDIAIVVDRKEVMGDDGLTMVDITGPRTQFKEVFALGLSVKF